jgi:prefoldin subunit 5
MRHLACSKDPSKIMVAIGFGFFLEATLDEALGIVDTRVKRLTEKADALTTQIAHMKAMIRVVLEVVFRFV